MPSIIPTKIDIFTTMKPVEPDLTLHLPRILCLHGGGVNAEVFQAQCRGLIRRLKKQFRFVFVDGPFICDPHPAIKSVYGDRGPFRRWLRWLPEHREIDAETATAEIKYQMILAMENDDELGATGDWVGLMGFSQGAKIAASVLYTQQKLVEAMGQEAAGSNFQFGVLLAGRAPLTLLDDRIPLPEGITDAAEISIAFQDWPDETYGTDHILRIPTIHVHGMKDPGLEFHRRMLDHYCDEDTSRLVEWDGAHRVPIRTADVDAVAQQILDLGRELRLI